MPREKTLVEPIKEYFIAYFDLLGYKKFFENYPEKVEDFLNTIYDAIKNTKAYLHGIDSSPIVGGFGQMSIQVRVFSDNILLCLEKGSSVMEYLRFLAFASITADIQRNFILQYGLFLRGGLTIGKLSFNDDFIFGQGLIDVVALEEHATYPRIIIGKTVLNYILQPHFVKQEDLTKACEIEKRAHAGEHISDNELAFYNSIAPAINMENFYMQYREHLIFKSFDGAVVLNYLYYIDINKLISPTVKQQILEYVKTFSPSDYQKLEMLNLNQKQRLAQHKEHIIEKIKEYGKYDDLEIDAEQKAELREYILKKYLWVLSFHNQVCIAYHFPECIINFGSTCDIRFMRMTVEIFESNTPGTNLTKETFN